MDARNDRPWQRDYTIKQTLVLAEIPGLRIIDQTLAPGERVPWHLHPDSDDLFICLRGTFEIHEINPARKTVLKPLERHLVPKREPHMVVNASDQECQLLTVQPGNYDFRRLPKLDGRRLKS